MLICSLPTLRCSVANFDGRPICGTLEPARKGWFFIESPPCETPGTALHADAVYQRDQELKVWAAPYGRSVQDIEERALTRGMKQIEKSLEKA